MTPQRLQRKKKKGTSSFDMMFVDLLTLTVALFIQQDFILPALRRAEAAGVPDTVHGAVMVEVVGAGSQILAGKDLGLLVRNSNSDATYQDDLGNDVVRAEATWRGAPGVKYCFRLRGIPGETYRLGVFLREIDEARLSQPDYMKAITDGFHVRVYRPSQAGLVRDATDPAAWPLHPLNRGNGFYLEFDLPSDVLKQ